MPVPTYQFTEDNWNNSDVSDDHQEFMKVMGRVASDFDKEIVEITVRDFADVGK